MRTAETHPPAITLVVVRTGASVAEIERCRPVARHYPESNLSDASSLSQHLKHLNSSSVPIMQLVGSQRTAARADYWRQGGFLNSYPAAAAPPTKMRYPTVPAAASNRESLRK